MRYVGWIVLILVFGAAGYGTAVWLQQPEPVGETAETGTATVGVGDERPDFSLPDLDGNMRSISEWDGDVLVVNFWATWCPPCRHEIPMFVEFQEEYGDQGVQFIGVAIDELQAVRDFANEHFVNYPNMIGEEDAMAIGSEWGNRVGALPYTVIVDRDGMITYTHRGEIVREEVEEQVLPLL